MPKSMKSVRGPAANAEWMIEVLLLALVIKTWRTALQSSKLEDGIKFGIISEELLWLFWLPPAFSRKEDIAAFAFATNAAFAFAWCCITEKQYYAIAQETLASAAQAI